METKPRLVYKTDLGAMWHGDSLRWLDGIDDGSIDLVVTSPPFALTRQLAYGNEIESDYVAWFHKFAEVVQAKLTQRGSFVIDLGGAWMKGSPTKSLYQYRVLIDLVDGLGYHLAEDFFWFNRSKLPGPRQWVNIDRTRVKDAVNVIWWLSKTASPKASNLRVLKPYSKAMLRMIERGTYNDGPRMSEHVIGKTWAKDQGGAIPPNVIEVIDGEAFEEFGGALHPPDNMLDFANTSSNDPYVRFCRANDIGGHPARFPRLVPEFFIKFLTEPGDLVVDIFGGSNMTGHVAEGLGRRWASCELDADYIKGSLGRFEAGAVTITSDGAAIDLDKSLYATADAYRSERERNRKAMLPETATED